MRGFMGEPYDQDPHPGRDHVFDETGHCFCGAETPNARDRRLVGYAIGRMSKKGISNAEFWRNAKTIALIYLHRND